MLPDKRKVIDAAIARLEDDHRRLVEAAEATRSGAIDDESRPENDKDTRALEATYLARGQAARVEELAETITRLRFMVAPEYRGDDAIGLAALVEVSVDGEPRLFLLVPVGGGFSVEVDARTVQLLAVSSPVGAAILGRRVGDDLEIRVAAHLREYEILRIA